MADKWDLSKIYPDEGSFDRDLAKLKEEIIPSLASHKGKLSDFGHLRSYLSTERSLEKLASRLYLYAECASDVDKRLVKNSARLAKVRLALSDLSEATAFESPEILAIGEEGIKRFLSENPEFKEFDHRFAQLFLTSKHVLSAEKEELASAFSPLLSEGAQLYSNLSVGDYAPKRVTLGDGKETTVSLSNWTSLIADAGKAEDRQRIFEALYSYFDERKNAYGEIYNTVLQGELSEMKARHYPSILESHLAGNKIPASVFMNLIETASQNAEPLHRYLDIRAKYLGLSKHRSYDRFLELAHSEKRYSYPEAKDIFFASISRFPADFQEKAHEVLKDGYVDVYPGLGKRTGAYSNGGYKDGSEALHPVILFNFEGRLDDCFTVAHESGHSIHTLYSLESQPVMKQEYTIFVAEIASTFNEHNLLDYMLSSGKLDRETKICLLQKAIDQIVSTFYRQTLFAHYEYDVSKMAEAGKPINFQVLSDEMTKLYKVYYGIDITEEKLKPLVWAYIPHLFYTPFYVYQYATSFTASMLLYELVKRGEPGAFERYLGLLKMGGSDFPIEEVRAAGVDLTKKDPFLAVTARMKELVDELERTLFAK
ncbi:MAG: oligoendopeptidase F family protein [Bacilli bacterium]|jgi:oligoendopeptidase F|nr:oligoendopeptidase F family protein [Bacilli bacterium]MCI2110733.1 oligoendopeptidase F family protein [Bacilli bacterium]